MLISSLKSLSKLKDCYSVTDLYISIHEGDTGSVLLNIGCVYTTCVHFSIILLPSSDPTAIR